MKTILCGLLAAFLILCGVITPAAAALPPEAYKGDWWPRLWNPTRCVAEYANLPDLVRKDDPAGVYAWFNPTTGRCERGGRAHGPQF